MSGWSEKIIFLWEISCESLLKSENNSESLRNFCNPTCRVVLNDVILRRNMVDESTCWFDCNTLLCIHISHVTFICYMEFCCLNAVGDKIQHFMFKVHFVSTLTYDVKHMNTPHRSEVGRITSQLGKGDHPRSTWMQHLSDPAASGSHHGSHRWTMSSR